jgi:hypothetical protein
MATALGFEGEGPKASDPGSTSQRRLTRSRAQCPFGWNVYFNRTMRSHGRHSKARTSPKIRMSGLGVEIIRPSHVGH